jgi:hypothetical protein
MSAWFDDFTTKMVHLEKYGTSERTAEWLAHGAGSLSFN